MNDKKNEILEEEVVKVENDKAVEEVKDEKPEAGGCCGGCS